MEKTFVDFFTVPLFFSLTYSTHFNYATAFALPAFLLLIATSIFYSGKRRYRTHDPQGSVLKESAKVWDRMVGPGINKREEKRKGRKSTTSSFLFNGKE
jgi:hypothetical protein